MKRILLLAVLVITASTFAFGQTPDKPTATPEKPATTPTNPTTSTTPSTPTNPANPTGEKVAATSAEPAVRQLFDELVVSYAKNDAAATARIFADDFTFTNPYGEVMTKEQRIVDIKPGGLQFTAYTTDEVNVRVYGDTAVVTGRATVKGKRGDRDISGQNRIMLVFVNRGGSWQAVASQSTSIAAQPAK